MGALTDDEPGPINNSCILAPGDGVTIRPGSDYAQINSTLWKFFYGTYGGGPEIVLRGNPANDLIIRSNSVSSSSLTTSNKEFGTESMNNTQPIDDVSQTENDDFDQTLTNNQSQALHSNQNSIDENQMTMTQTQIVDEKTMNGESSGPTTTTTTTTKPFNLSPPTSPVHIPSTSIIAPTKKPAKYVSFEDNDSSTSSDRESGSTNDHMHSRRGKHNYSTSPANSWEILSKKDRRHRSIQSNGFFGPEGRRIENYSFLF